VESWACASEEISVIIRRRIILYANHSYETLEIIATEIPWGSREYLSWVTSETGQADVSS